MIGRQSFSERVGRGFRNNPYMYLPTQVAPLVFGVLAYFVFTAGMDSRLTLVVAFLLLAAFFVWLALVWRWSQRKYLARKGAQRRRVASRNAR